MALALILISTTTFAFAKDQNPGLKLDNEEWMVFNNETVYPILDNLHALLNSAYVAFENKNYDEAVAHFKAGAANLRSQSESQEAPYRYKSLSAAAEMDNVAKHIAKGVAGEAQVADAIRRAYMADWEPQWVITDDSTAVNFLEKPGEHMAEATMNYKNGNYADAAYDLRQAAAYMDLTKGDNPGSRELRMMAGTVTDKYARPTVAKFENTVREASRQYAANDLDRRDIKLGINP